MARPTPAPARKRVGRVSLYEHHGAAWLYYRDRGKSCRRKVGDHSLAEFEASLLNAELVAAEANLPLAQLLSQRFGKQFTLPRALHAPPAPPTVPTAAVSVPLVSVALLRSRFLAHHEHVAKSSVGTLSRYASATLHLENFGREQQIEDASVVSAAAFLAYLRSIEVSPNGHAKCARRKLADKGVKYVLDCCRSLYHFGVNFDVLPPGTANPFARRGATQVRIRDAKPIFVFDPQQELAFFNKASSWAFALHFTLAKTGLRPGELVHLLIEDLDLADGWLHVRSKPELGWTTKTNTERRVPLLPEVVALLRICVGTRSGGVVFLRERLAKLRTPPTLLGNRAELAAAARLRIAETRERAGRALTRREEARAYERLWQDVGGVPVDRVRSSFIRVARGAGLAGATCPKSWRHTFATLLQQANVDLLVRQETMGHKPASAARSALGMTGAYTHTTPAFQKGEIARALGFRTPSLALVGLNTSNNPNISPNKKTGGAS